MFDNFFSQLGIIFPLVKKTKQNKTKIPPVKKKLDPKKIDLYQFLSQNAVFSKNVTNRFLVNSLSKNLDFYSTAYNHTGIKIVKKYNLIEI